VLLGRMSLRLSGLLLPTMAILLAGVSACSRVEKPPASERAATDSAEISLFDGKSLGDWKVTDFGGHGDVMVEEGQIRLETGVALTGITWTKNFPKIDYELTLEAMRVDGDDFFCGLTFPVDDAPCSLIVGGWGGTTVGLSSIDGADASENETSSYHTYKQKQWYPVRLRVTKQKIEAWVGKEQVVNFERGEHTLSIRFEVEPSKPLGIATWCTTGALRNIKYRKL
jgi:hypothetical protein